MNSTERAGVVSIDPSEASVKTRHIVSFIFYDELTGRVLSERRRSDSKNYPDQLVFPAGKVWPTEGKDYIRAFLREVRQELGDGAKPYDYIPLDTDEPLLAAKGAYTIHPFLVLGWEGTLPDSILDMEDNPLVWETLDEVAASPIENRAEIIRRVREKLTTHYVLCKEPYEDLLQEPA